MTAREPGKLTGFSPDEVGRYANKEVHLTGEAGTLLLADVRGFHRGTPQQDRSRAVLVNYIVRSPGDLDLAK